MEHVVPEDEGSGENSNGTRRVVEGGALGLSDLAWSMAQRRASVIAPWAAQESVSALAARDAARSLKMSERAIYLLLLLQRQSGGVVASLAPCPSPGGRSKGRLTAAVKQIVADAIGDEYLSKQNKPMQAVI